MLSALPARLDLAGTALPSCPRPSLQLRVVPLLQRGWPTDPYLVSTLQVPGNLLAHHRITESQNSRGWKGPLWVI